MSPIMFILGALIGLAVGYVIIRLLFAVYVLHAADTRAAAREASETLTLDVLHRVAWFLGFDLKVEIGPREAAS